MDSARQKLVEKLHTANHVLVTVSRDPSVDQLAACIGLTLLINKTGKHASAVFSGQVPSTLEFLKPEETLEKNTDSLRDFIIALDKSKADKLRYKVEDDVVRIFITPYKTSISQEDLEFSQGDFNVDLVIAIGVTDQAQLDEAILAHGRILHDATVSTMNLTENGALGSLNWSQPAASSLCELATDIAQDLGSDLIDSQIATALLTGIVAETERFSNEKTTPQTMSVSAVLMSHGANQQLVASKLQETVPPMLELAETENNAEDERAEDKASDQTESSDGSLEISHQEEPANDSALPELAGVEFDAAPDTPAEPELPAPEVKPEQPVATGGSKMITEPPTLGGRLTANTEPEGLDPSTDPLSMMKPADAQILSRQPDAPAAEAAPLPDTTAQPEPAAPAQAEPAQLTPPPADFTPAAHETPPSPAEPQTLSEIEASVHGSQAASPDLNAAREEVLNAMGSTTPPPEPIQALNAQPLGPELHEIELEELEKDQPPAPNAPPPVPPPIPFSFTAPPAPPHQQ